MEVYTKKNRCKTLIYNDYLLFEDSCEDLLKPISGERGIRTPGPVKVNGFQDRRDRPLCHLSEF